MAQKLLDLRKGESLEGRLRLVKSNPPTLKAWSEQFLDSIQHANTKRTYKSCIHTLNESFGAARLSDIGPENIEQFKITRLRVGAGPAIINRNLAVLRRMLKLAARQRLIARTPFEEIEFLEERSSRRQPRILSFEEQIKLEAVAPPLLRSLIVVLTEAGLRVGREALRLRWDDVDLVDGLIHMRDSKTVAGRRIVPMSGHCRATLEEWKRTTGPAFSPFVFGNPNNPTIHLKAVRKTWMRALKLAKLPYFPIYNLRATFASRLSAAGVSDNTVAGMLGHSSTAIVGTYAKLVDDVRQQVIRKLEDFRDASMVQRPSKMRTPSSTDKNRWLN
jgi:integrase